MTGLLDGAALLPPQEPATQRMMANLHGDDSPAVVAASICTRLRAAAAGEEARLVQSFGGSRLARLSPLQLAEGCIDLGILVSSEEIADLLVTFADSTDLTVQSGVLLDAILAAPPTDPTPILPEPSSANGQEQVIGADPALGAASVSRLEERRWHVRQARASPFATLPAELAPQFPATRSPPPATPPDGVFLLGKTAAARAAQLAMHDRRGAAGRPGGDFAGAVDGIFGRREAPSALEAMLQNAPPATPSPRRAAPPPYALDYSELRAEDGWRMGGGDDAADVMANGEAWACAPPSSAIPPPSPARPPPYATLTSEQLHHLRVSEQREQLGPTLWRPSTPRTEAAAGLARAPHGGDVEIVPGTLSWTHAAASRPVSRRGGGLMRPSTASQVTLGWG